MFTPGKQQARVSRRKGLGLTLAITATTTMSVAPALSQSMMIFVPPSRTTVTPPPPPPMAPPPPPPPAPITVTPVTTVTTAPPPPPKVDIPVFGFTANYQYLVPTTISIPPTRGPRNPKKPQPKPVASKKEEPKTETATQAQPVSRPQPIPVIPGVFQFSLDCGTGLSNEKDNFEMITGRGALYSLEAQDRVNLQRGHMVVIAGDVNLHLKAGRLEVQVIPGSAMAADVLPDGTTKLYSLPTFEKLQGFSTVEAPAEFGQGLEPVAVKPGEQVVLSDQSLNDQDLIAADGIAVSPVEGGLTLARKTGGHMHLVHYSMKRMQENEALIGCHKVTIPPTANLNKVRSAIAQAASEEDSSAEKSSTTNGGTPNHNKPVAATELIASRSFSTNSKPTTIFNDKNSAVFAEGNALVNTIAPNKLELVKGSLVARCSKTLEIDAIGAHVTLSKGCVALVKADEHFLKVTNLSDLENDSIKVAVGDKSISILPARELVLSDRAPSLSQVFDVHQIGHRTIVSRQMSEKIWATDSEVALPDELKYQPLVSWIRTEHVNAGQPLVNQVLKTAAVLQIIRNPGQYVRGEIDDEVETTAMIAHGCSSCTH